MTPSETTTLRVPVALRDEIARLATERGTTMLDVVTHAIRQLTRDLWWATVQGALDQVGDDDLASYRAQAVELDCTAGDGLG